MVPLLHHLGRDAMNSEVETSLHESLRDNVRLLGDSLGRTIAKDLSLIHI